LSTAWVNRASDRLGADGKTAGLLAPRHALLLPGVAAAIRARPDI